MTAFNLKILPVQAGILVPCNGEPERYLLQRFKRAHDDGSQTQLSKFLEEPLYWQWDLFLAVHGLYISDDVVSSYTKSGEVPPRYRFRLPKSVPDMFREFLEINDSKCIEIMLLAYPELMISFDMLDKACSQCYMSLEARYDLLSRYVRQNHPNGLPNLDMADGLDIMQLVVEKEPALTGNMQLLICIWKENSDIWSQKTWPLMDLLFSRKVDLDLNQRLFRCIGGDTFEPIGKLSPDRERFLTLLLCQPETSVRVDEHCFEYLVRNDEESLLRLVSSLRPHTQINEDTVSHGYKDGFWQTILTHPCPSVSLKDLATTVIRRHPPDAVGFFLSCNKDVRIDDDMLFTALKRWNNHSVDIFRLLVDSGRLESDQVSHEALLDALTLKGHREEFSTWAALFLARGWVTPKDVIFRVALKTHLKDGYINREMCGSYSWLAEQGITVKLSEICNGALLDLRINQLRSDAEATVDRYLELFHKSMDPHHRYLRDFEQRLAGWSDSEAQRLQRAYRERRMRRQVEDEI